MRRVFLIGVVFPFFLLTYDAFAQIKTTEADNLAGIAKSYTESKYELLVYGVTNKLSINKAAWQLIDRNTPGILNDRQSFSDEGTGYSGFKTQLNVKRVIKKEDYVIVFATEKSELKVAQAEYDPLAPRVTILTNDHKFKFRIVNNGYLLESDDIALDGHQEPNDIKVRNLPKVSDLNNIVTLHLYEETTKQNANKVNVSQNTPNRNRIVAYAYKYAISYNPKYKSFPADCTNFVSQAVKAGGWKEIGEYYWDPVAWFYKAKGKPSWSWAGAQNWFWFVYFESRGELVPSTSDLELGDIIQADWEPDGSIDHSMIITKKDSKGRVYLTYHSKDTVDACFTNIFKKHSLANFYGWHLISTE